LAMDRHVCVLVLISLQSIAYGILQSDSVTPSPSSSLRPGSAWGFFVPSAAEKAGCSYLGMFGISIMHSTTEMFVFTDTNCTKYDTSCVLTNCCYSRQVSDKSTYCFYMCGKYTLAHEHNQFGDRYAVVSQTNSGCSGAVGWSSVGIGTWGYIGSPLSVSVAELVTEYDVVDVQLADAGFSFNTGQASCGPYSPNYGSLGYYANEDYDVNCRFYATWDGYIVFMVYFGKLPGETPIPDGLPGFPLYSADYFNYPCEPLTLSTTPSPSSTLSTGATNSGTQSSTVSATVTPPITFTSTSSLTLGVSSSVTATRQLRSSSTTPAPSYRIALVQAMQDRDGKPYLSAIAFLILPLAFAFFIPRLR